MKLSADQDKAMGAVAGWIWRGEPLLKLGGLAGTGKTTLLGEFASRTNAAANLLVAYAAPTGRAASVLARKLGDLRIETTNRTRLLEGRKFTGRASEVCYPAGSPEEDMPFVGTIHRLVYRPVIEPVTEELKGWTKRETLDRDYDLLVLDEASMVADDMLDDLQRFGVPILAVGDHGQLPPVMSSGNLMRDPDIKLEKIHRQAAGSPIIGLAHHVRGGGLLREFAWDRGSEALSFCGKGEIARVLEDVLPGADLDAAALCWTNRMRVRLNGMARQALGRKGPPGEGDLVVALRNYPPICNGMRGMLTGASSPGHSPWHVNFDVTFPGEDIDESVVACAPQFNRDKTFGSVEELRERGLNVYTMSAAGRLFDFGYALTAHKMQGSQAATVIVYLDRPEDPDSDDYRRWTYTAITRASKRLILCR